MADFLIPSVLLVPFIGAVCCNVTKFYNKYLCGCPSIPAIARALLN